MSDRFNQTLNFAADPPEGGGGTKAALGGAQPVSGDVPQAPSTDVPQVVDSTAIEPPATADPPDNGGGTKTGSTTTTTKSTTSTN